MGDLKIGEGFIDAVMIRITATGAAAVGLFPTCILTRLSTGARVGLTVAEVSNGIYKVTDMAPGADDEYLTEWAVAGANTIYTAFKLFKVGGGVIADWEDGGRLDLLLDGIIADIGVFPSANYATLAAYVEDIRARLIVILADTNEIQVSLADGGFTDLLIDAIKAKTDTIVWGDITTIDTLIDGIVADIGVFPSANYATLAAYVEDIRTRLIGIIADIGVFPSANYATLAAYVEDIRARLIVILADTNEVQASLADGGFTDLLIDAIKAKTDTIVWGDITTLDTLIDGIVADIGVFPSANYATLAAYVEDVRTRLIAIVGDTNELQVSLADGGFTDLLIDAIKARTDISQNSELFGSVMLEQLQLGAGAADVDLPDIILPDIPGTIDRVYLHFKVRMIENTYNGVNKLAGAQSIRIKTDAGAWGVDDIPAITFPDDYVTLAAETREAGDVFGGMIDVSSEVTAFNDTYEMRWEDGQVDQDFINFNDIEMFLRVIFH